MKHDTSTDFRHEDTEIGRRSAYHDEICRSGMNTAYDGLCASDMKKNDLIPLSSCLGVLVAELPVKNAG